MKFLNALRNSEGGSTDAMRQTTSLTMAYLLEQNRRFEFYIRGKVEELEARVAAQQARTSVNTHNGVDAGEATRPVAPVAVLDETQPMAPADRADVLDFSSAGFGSDEVEEFFKDEPVTPENEAIAPFQAELADLETKGMAADEAPGWTNWEAALVGMSDTSPEAEEVGATSLPAEPDEAQDDLSDSLLPAWLQTNLEHPPARADESEEMIEPDGSEPVVLKEADKVSAEIATANIEESDGVDDEAALLTSLQVGPVEDWA